MKKATLFYTAMLLLATGLAARFVPSSVFEGVFTHTHTEQDAHVDAMKNVSLPVVSGSSDVFCNPWQDMSLGSGTGSSAYAACMPDTIVLTTNAVTPAMATSDNHEMVYHELCGNGSLTVKIPSLSGGAAGLFVRESSAAGSRKCAVMTQKGAQVFRQLRSSTGMFQQQAAVNASGHEWLRIVRSGSSVVTYWSTNGSTWNLAFTTPFATADNCVLLGMYAYSSNSNNDVQAVFTNVTVTQSDATPATTIAFADSLIAAQSGDSIQICVTLQNPCVCSAVSVDVVLSSDSLPHFEGYEPVTLTFNGSDTMQCFYVLTTQADTSGGYSFELADVQGGNNTAITGPTELIIQLEAGEGVEELPPGLCGAFVKALPEIDSTKTYYSDRFGNLYEQEELLLPENLNSGCGCDEFTNEDIPGLSASHFNLVYEDCVNNYNAGFNQQSGGLGIVRRKVACRVFADLSQIITQRSSPCEGDEDDKVNIRFLPYNDPQVVSWQNGPVLAAAAPLYDDIRYTSEGGIMDGLPWRVINNGRYTILSPVSLYHGIVGVDFTKPFYTGEAPPGNMENNLYDLYSVMMHEALHLMGFHTLISPLTGDYRSSAFTSYSRYDTFLKLEGGSNVVARDAGNPYLWNLNISQENLHKSCLSSGAVNMVFPPLAGNDLPIYTGQATDNIDRLRGSAFSHLDVACPGAAADYLMKPAIFPGVRVDIGEAELKILCALGYEVAPLENCSCAAAGDHDFSDGCNGPALAIEICENTGQTINISSLLANDQPGQSISHLVSITPGMGELQNAGSGTFFYTPCAPGIHRFKYVPTDEGCQDGSTVLVEILVTRCLDDCNFFSSNDPVPAGNACNLICNSDITAYQNGQNAGNVIIRSISCAEECLDLPGWFAAIQTPDYAGNYTVNSGSGSLDFRGRPGGATESAYTPVEAVAGDYFFSYYTRGRNIIPTGNTAFEYEITARFIDMSVVEQFGDCNTQLLGFDQVDLNAGNHVVLDAQTFTGPHQNNFERTATCISVSGLDEMVALWLAPEITSAAQFGTKGVIIDEIELIPDAFSAGEDFVSTGCDPIGGPFCMLSNATVLYEWFEVSGGDPQLIAEYTVLNGVATVISGNVDEETQQLYVAPLQTTTYLLRRSLTTPHNLPGSFAFCTTEDAVTVTVGTLPPPPVFSVISEDCGEVVFYLDNLHPADSYLINYGDGSSGTALVHAYENATDTYLASVVISNNCGETNLNAIVETVYCPPFSCETCSESLIGEDGQTLKLSVALSTGLLPNNGFNTGLDIRVCVKGTLLIDQDYNIVNGIFYMLPGSRIEIQDGSALAVIDSDFSGCDNMWYAIEVQQGGGMKMIGSRVADAQYAVYLHSYSGNDPFLSGGVSIYDSDFDNNFVGLLAGGASPGRVNAAVGSNRYTQTAAALLPPFTGQSSAPAGLPEQNQHALAGIVADNLANFNSLHNRFEQLTSGIVARHSILGSYADQFISIRSNNTVYPAWDYRGKGVSIQSNGIHSAMVEQGYFDDCPQGIMANNAVLKATENEMLQMEVGIWAAIGSAGGISITNNEIEATRLGIVFAHPDPNGGAVITNNIVNTDTENAIAGIWQLFSLAPALLDNNTVTVGKAGMGIGSVAAAKSTLRDNNVSLSDPTAAAAGIDLANVTKSLLEDNTVTGGGTGGPDNIALRIVSSAGNVYCCNTLSNTRIGARISGGSLATDNFRGTSFSNHAISLQLPDVNAILGSQTHTQNCWGANAGAAVYGEDENNPVPLVFAQEYPFTVDPSIMSCFWPASHAPVGWFEDPQDTEYEGDICSASDCEIDMFAPESDDVKRMVLGDTMMHQTVIWELQRYIYERLQGETVSNPTILEFLARSDTNSIGAFYAIQEGINAMFSADSLERNQLKDNLTLAEQKLDSLVHIDEQMLEADSADIAALMPVKMQLLGDLYELSSDNKDLAEGIWSNVKSEAGKLYSQNDSISATHSFEINEKAVNGLYLNWLDNDTEPLDSTAIALLQSIAEQCPITDGNAIYQARAFLALLKKEHTNYNDSLLCAPIQALIMPAVQLGVSVDLIGDDVRIFPNPASNEVRLVWREPNENPGQIQVSDIFGRTIIQLDIASYTLEKVIHLGDLSQGVYVFRIRLSGKDAVRKVIVQH